MKKLRVEIKFTTMPGFDEKDFKNAIAKNVNELVEISANLVNIFISDDICSCDIEFANSSNLPLVEAVLGGLMDLPRNEYPYFKIANISQSTIQ